MRELPPSVFLILIAFSIPVAIELRTVAGFFGVDLPFVAVIVFEAVFLVALLIVYVMGRLSPDPGDDASAS
ncbi:CbaC protein [Halobellus marinus]|jgi:hypothetical protein|uniref:CbaC protein n=1 Tax=Halobellus TaxID=1073986 RepID=UPI0028AC6EF5|nr:CbaC protein [Halobellus sp. DFY28]